MPQAVGAPPEPASLLEADLRVGPQLVREHEPGAASRGGVVGQRGAQRLTPLDLDLDVIVDEREQLARRLGERTVAREVEADLRFHHVAGGLVRGYDLGRRVVGRRVVDDEDVDARPRRGHGALERGVRQASSGLDRPWVQIATVIVAGAGAVPAAVSW